MAETNYYAEGLKNRTSRASSKRGRLKSRVDKNFMASGPIIFKCYSNWVWQLYNEQLYIQKVQSI